MLEGSDADVREQAIPFREGDEVLVTIVEPHMYEVDDAVAKVDGYIISVIDGGAHVGEKRLVRIEEAGRSAATAVLVEGQPMSPNGGGAKSAAKSAAKPAAKASEEKPAPRKRVRTTRPKPAPKAEAEVEDEPAADAEQAASDGDDVESTPRRRGRRGGRRRSAAKAETTSD